MYLYKSNRLEELADTLSEILAKPLADSFVPETIVVQSRGMEAWLKMALSERLGVWANCRFPFPKKAVSSLLNAEAGEIYPESESLIWHLMRVIESSGHHPSIAPLASYWQEPDRDLKLFRFCRRVADVFSQYMVYRGDLLASWAGGRDQDWQAVLWRELMKMGVPAGQINVGDEQPHRDWPHRIFLFGISSLPPAFLAAFHAVSSRVPVHVFQFAPSRMYWANLTRTKNQIALDGNRLLNSMGTLAKDFQNVLESFQYHEDDRDLFKPNPQDTLLAVIQNDMLDYRARTERIALSPDDQSLRFHCCHSAIREVEVLQDQLLDLFNTTEMTPADVVVMVPDIEVYAPLIDAVFGLEVSHENFIPYTIADRLPRNQYVLIDALFRLFEMAPGRWTASDFLGLLTIEPIRHHFKIEEDDLGSLALWVRDSGIRWAWNASHRKQYGQPEVTQNTWRFGLNRMALGFCMPNETDSVFCGFSPYSEIEGSMGALLGKFIQACEALSLCLSQMNRSHTLAQWRVTLDSILNAVFVQGTATDWQLKAIRGAVDGICVGLPESMTDRAVAPRILADLLDKRLRTEYAEQGFMRGGITFCALLPLRSIPFRQVCLLGMDDGVFPRSSFHASFDRLAEDYRPGDRDRRLDDRYLFVESILAARDRLSISFKGRGLTDQTLRPPAVVVCELMDIIDASVSCGEGRPSSALTTIHPLQAHDIRYFDGSGPWFSFSEVAWLGAKSLQGVAGPPTPFFTGALEDVPLVERRKLELHELIQFFGNPTAAVLRKRLLMGLPRIEIDQVDREPIDLVGLDRFLLASQLLDDVLAGKAISQATWSASGKLPLGRAGLIQFQIIAGIVDRLASAVKPLYSAADVPHHFRVALPNGTDVKANLKLHGDDLLYYRVGSLHGKQLISAWIAHLALCCVRSDATSTLFGVEGGGVKKMRFKPVEGPFDILNDLVDTYWMGLSEPLLFFPKSSWSYAHKLLTQRNKNRFTALSAANRQWRHGPNPEGDHRSYRFIFGDADLRDLDHEHFQQMAEAVCGPALAHLEDLP